LGSSSGTHSTSGSNAKTAATCAPRAGATCRHHAIAALLPGEPSTRRRSCRDEVPRWAPGLWPTVEWCAGPGGERRCLGAAPRSRRPPGYRSPARRHGCRRPLAAEPSTPTITSRTVIASYRFEVDGCQPLSRTEGPVVVEWRAVEHDPTVPATREPLTDEQAQRGGVRYDLSDPAYRALEISAVRLHGC
jgi:hypothetical protein